MNAPLAQAVISFFSDIGVEEFVVCAGARNGTLVLGLIDSGQEVTHFFDERSAAFFALGRATTGHRVAVVTTSGTAVAELLPAVVEAHYQGLPLILVTADRPRSFRGSGAPQAIVQPGIFSDYVSQCWDIASPEECVGLLQGWDGASPVQVNICFKDQGEPGDAGAVAGRLPDGFFTGGRRTAVLVGDLREGERGVTRDFLDALGCPYWAEASSGLRECPGLSHLAIRGGERELRALGVEQVLRFGGVPSCRFWRDLEGMPGVPVVSVARTGYPGLARSSVVLRDIASLGAPVKQEPYMRVDSGGVEKLLEKYVAGEQAVVRRLSEAVPPYSAVLLGNSLPIREWNAFATWKDRGLSCFTNRGANGIDGLLSTFFGVSRGFSESWAVVGDLSALYDLNAPWVSSQLGSGRRRIAVINNGGGKIFSLMPALEGAGQVIENRHTLGFDKWAAMWGWDYVRVKGDDRITPVGDSCILELVPDPAQTEAFWGAL